MFSLKIPIFVLYIISLAPFPSTCLDRGTVYMESDCGGSVSVVTSFQLESSTGMTYINQLDCTYTITAPSGWFVFAIIKRFELEPSLSGTCTDYVNFHDGASTSSAKLNANDVCGSGSSIPGNFTSTGESMTLHFVTDNYGTYLGFSINFVAATSGVCSSSQLECNTSICIDSALKCDGFDGCGDSSDEDNCEEISAGSSVNVIMIVVIALVAVAVISVIVAIVAYRIHARNKWKKFINMHIDDDDGMVATAPSYPITHLYYKGVKGHPTVYESNIRTVTNETMSKPGTDVDSGNSSKELTA